MAVHVARMEDSRGAFKMLTAKPTANRPLRKIIRKLDNNIRMDLKEIYQNY
jgi:hypothetical protein